MKEKGRGFLAPTLPRKGENLHRLHYITIISGCPEQPKSFPTQSQRPLAQTLQPMQRHARSRCLYEHRLRQGIK